MNMPAGVLLKIIHKKTIKQKIKINKFFIMLKRNSININVHSNTVTARTANFAIVKTENRLSYRLFWKFFQRFR